MKALVVAGGLPQISLINELKRRGIATILVDGSKAPIALPYADKFYQENIFDVEKIKSIAINEKVDFLITCCADQVLLTVAQVSEMLGLPWYIDYQTAELVSNKEYMKKVFRDNEIPTSQYVVMENLDFSVIDHLKYPLIVKPVDAYSSRGVRKVLNDEELEKAFNDAVNISRTNTAIVEEFCEGEEFSVDVFVTDGKAEVLCISSSEKLKVDSRFVIFRGKFHDDLSDEFCAEISDISQKIADAFHIMNAPMLIQLIYDGEHFSVLEFCARTGGAMKYILISRACGVDVIKAVVDLTMGIKPEIAVKKPQSKYIVNDFIYCREGIFDHVEGFQEMVDSGLLEEFHVLRPKGFAFSGDAYSSGDRVAGITIQANTVEEFNKKHEIIVDSIKIIDDNGNDIMRRELLPNF